VSGTNWTYEDFKKNFKKKTTLDLDSYKQRQMERRIRQMMDREGCKSFYDFYSQLEKDEEFLSRFLTYLTINTSGFFRDDHVYQNLQNKVLPELLKNHDKLNLWSAGCSNGEEPYTLALVLEELNALNRVGILATDFDRKALERAQEGVFNFRQVEKVPSRILERGFTRNGSNYQIKPKYKKIITYKHQDLLKSWPTFKEMHLILCRNVFIYFKSEIQEELIKRFVKQLTPGGYLVIGCSEYINEADTYGLQKVFQAIYNKTK